MLVEFASAVDAKLLKSLEGIFSLFSKCALKSLNNQADFDSAIRRFDPSCPSQAVRRSEKVPLMPAEKLANGGLLRICCQSPGSVSGHSQSEIADSLWQSIEKLPFSGDCGRRPSSICAASPSSQCSLPNSPPWPPANWECPARPPPR